jgi:hypothetical protein
MGDNVTDSFRKVDDLLYDAQTNYFHPTSAKKVQDARTMLNDILITLKPRLQPLTASNDRYVLENPNFAHVQAHIRLGRLSEAEDETPAAIKHYQEGLKIFPKCVQGHYWLGKALRLVAGSQQDLEKSESHLKQAISIAAELQEARKAVIQKSTSSSSFSFTTKTKPSGSSTNSASANTLNTEFKDRVQNPLYNEEISYGVEAENSLLFAFLQSSEEREKDAQSLMKKLGYTYRLSTDVLSYEYPPLKRPYRPDIPFLQAIDNVLPMEVLERMRTAFGNHSPFWSEHRYGPEAPYFSYVHSLEDSLSTNPSQKKSGLDQIIQYLHRQACVMYPEARNAKFAEWWAHCRPHPHGHQLHFDSDDEGRVRNNGKPRHPIVGSVLYLEGDIGGPTLVTNQRLGDPLADHGWLVYPKENRYVVFRGSVLHGEN